MLTRFLDAVISLALTCLESQCLGGPITPEYDTKPWRKKYAEPRKSNEIARLDLSFQQRVKMLALATVVASVHGHAYLWFSAIFIRSGMLERTNIGTDTL
jgi:hypothetical protein